MALFIVTAIGSDDTAAAGNMNNAVIVVSVTSSAGQAISTLHVSDFTIRALESPQNTVVGIASPGFANLGGGYYRLHTHLKNNSTAIPWVAGIYIFAVSAHHGTNPADNGQALCSINVA
jgi:hypothetical protein